MIKAEAVRHYGSQKKLASILGVSDAAVSRWGEIIPEKQAFRLERITEGGLRYRPELYRKGRAVGSEAAA